MDSILLNKLVFSGCHGVTAEERSKPQRIRVSVRMWLELSCAAQTDDIYQTLNYSNIRKEVQHIIENQSYNLVESMTNAINSRIMSFRQVFQVRTIVTKLDIRGRPTIIMTKTKAIAA
jgi:dihydroneopterin aldolase